MNKKDLVARIAENADILTKDIKTNRINDYRSIRIY